MFRKLTNFLLHNNTNRQTILKNTFWLSFGEIISRLIKMFIFIYAARYLGVTQWGIFSYGLALVGIFSVFSDIGVNTILLREASKQSEKIGSYISTSFVIKFVLSLLSSLLLLSMIFFVREESIKHIIPFIMIMLFIDGLREFGFSLNRAFERMEIEAVVKIISSVVLMIGAIYIVYKNPTAISLISAYIIAGIISIIILFITVYRKISSLILFIDKKLIKPIFIESWPIGIVAIFGALLASIDTAILGWFDTTTEVGYYAAAQKPIQIILLIPALMATALIPFFSRSAGKDDQSFSKVLGRVITLSLFLMTFISIFTIIFAPFLITTLFGSQYLRAVPILQIIAISSVASVPSIFLSNALIAHNKQKKVISFIAIGALSNIILSFILIPPYGIYGAAISFTLSQILANISMVIYTRSIPALNFKLNLKYIGSDIKSLFNHD